MAAPSGPPGRLIRMMADAHHGVVARRELLARGFTRHQVQWGIESGWLVPVHPGVYRVGSGRMTHRARWMAALLACGDAAVLSHVSAAGLWRLVEPFHGPVHVTVSHRSAARRNGIIIHRTRALIKAERRKRHGIPVTSVERTLLDLAATVSPAQLRDAFDEAERLGVVNRSRLRALCEGARGRSGGAVLRELLRVPSLPLSETRSELERRFLRFCRERGLPSPAVNVPVLGYEVDVFWPDQRLIVELDGWSTHRDRVSFEGDRARDAALQVAGCRVVRVTGRRLDRGGDQLEAELRALLRLARLA